MMFPDGIVSMGATLLLQPQPPLESRQLYTRDFKAAPPVIVMIALVWDAMIAGKYIS